MVTESPRQADRGRSAAWLPACLGLLLGACAEPPPEERGALRVVDVVSAPGHTGVGFRDVDRAVNGVRGGGRWSGGLDVFTLGDQELILSVPEPVVDGEGPELAVFENPFDVSGAAGRFMEPAVVEVSADCEEFLPFPHDYLADDPSRHQDDPALWSGFAGVGTVQLHADRSPLPPLDPVAGGDRFDLAALPGEAGEELRAEGFVCLRLTSAWTWTDPRTGLPFPADPIADGADIDGVYVRAP